MSVCLGAFRLLAQGLGCRNCWKGFTAGFMHCQLCCKVTKHDPLRKFGINLQRLTPKPEKTQPLKTKPYIDIHLHIHIHITHMYIHI